MPILQNLVALFKNDARPALPAVIRTDANWSNSVTNIGVKGKDKRMSAVANPFVLSVGQLDISYQSDDIIAKIIDRIPEEMFREGYKICLEGVNEEDPLTSELQTQMEALEVNQKLELGEKFARLYGGAGLYIGVEDGLSPEEPLNLDQINRVTHLILFDRFEITSAGELDRDPKSNNFGKPLYYRLATVTPQKAEQLVRIHNTRILRFEGSILPRRLAAFFDYWGQSILNRIYTVVMNYNTSNDAVASLIQDFNTLVLKMQELENIVTMGDKGDEILQKRLEMAAFAHSVINALIIRSDEEIKQEGRPVTGLAELVNIVGARLVAATDMPHTVLFGDSPSGLGATGNSEITHFYDHIKNLQKSRVQPKILRLAEIFMAAKQGPFRGQVKPCTVHFNPLWQLDEKEQAEVRKTMADADGIYLDRQVLDPEEVANSRFGTGKFSIETSLDADVRKAMENGDDEEAQDEPADAEKKPTVKNGKVPVS